MIQYLHGDCRQVLKTLPEGSVHCCITSPPYFGLRDYGKEEQIGLEATPGEFVQSMVDVFREVRRVLRDDGTLWLNLGDSYAGSGKGQTRDGSTDPKRAKTLGMKLKNCSMGFDGFKPKDMIGIPWRVAFALQEDGWYLRSDIVWNKPNCLPESVTDRPTKSHEYIFLLAKSRNYYYDAEAIKETALTNENRPDGIERNRTYGYNSKYHGLEGHNLEKDDHKNMQIPGKNPNSMHKRRTEGQRDIEYERRNKRTVWSVPTIPFADAHFAVYPPDLIRPCILAGCPPGGMVLDPFGGSGTTAMVAEQEGRNCTLIELNEEYIDIQKSRTAQTSLLSTP